MTHKKQIPGRDELYTNHIFYQYVTSRAVWCIDETKYTRPNCSVFLVTNILSGVIVGYAVTEKGLNGDVLFELMQELFQCVEDRLLEKPLIIHGDMAAVYDEPKFRSLLDRYKVLYSSACEVRFSNQVAEGVNSGFKKALVHGMLASGYFEVQRKDALAALRMQNPEEGRLAVRNGDRYLENCAKFRNLFLEQIDWPEFYPFIPETINLLNIKPHKLIPNKSRLEVEKFYAEAAQTKLYAHHIAQNKSKNASVIQQALTLQFEANPLDKKYELIVKNDQLLLDEIKPTKTADAETENFAEIITDEVRAGTKQLAELLIASHNNITGQQEATLEVLDELKTSQAFLMERARKKAAEDDLKLQAKLRRQNTKHGPRRTALMTEHLSLVYKAIGKQNSYLQARQRAYVCLLFVTGVRSCELLPFKVKQIKEMLKEGYLCYDSTKTNQFAKKAYLTTAGRNILAQRVLDFQILTRDKSPDDFLFTQEGKPEPVSRSHIQKQINSVLKEVGESFPEPLLLSTHSFRIGFITNLWKQNVDLVSIAQLIGHNRIETTKRYIETMSDAAKKELMTRIN